MAQGDGKATTEIRRINKEDQRKKGKRIVMVLICPKQ